MLADELDYVVGVDPHRDTHALASGKRCGLTVARAGALAAKKAGLCQLRALLVTCPEPLRSELRSLTRARLLGRLAAVRPDRHRDAELRGTLIALRALARRVQAL